MRGTSELALVLTMVIIQLGLGPHPVGTTMAATISASQFKARCLGLMDQVAATGEVLVITKNGRPVAELHPCPSQRRDTPFGLHPTLEICGDVITPLVEPWDVQG